VVEGVVRFAAFHRQRADLVEIGWLGRSQDETAW
jgi:hypothetical protein